MLEIRPTILGMRRITGALLIGSALAGCGQKGPLTLPSENPNAQSTPQKPAGPGDSASPAVR
jgi:predicted small lipoprotein YifL